MPTAAATAAAEIIIRETAYAVGGEVRPLPLLGMFGAREPHGWGPVYQMELLEAGHKLFPWLSWPDDIDVEDEDELEDFDDYYKDYVEYCAALGLPLSFMGTQWENILLEDDYATGDAETSSPLIGVDGNIWLDPEKGTRKLNPFGLLAHWDAPAAEYIDRDSFRRLQSWYPSPPMVMFQSNNETVKLQWPDLETDCKHYVDTYGTEQTDAFKTDLLAEEWTERYQRMIATMRSTLESDSEAWESVARFTAYDAGGLSFVGRWAQWQEYALIADDVITPDWNIWDGGTYSYYSNYWQTDLGDYLVYSNQTEACNFPFQETEAKSENADFLFELALWTGDGKDNSNLWWPAKGYAEEYEAISKTCQYYALGQDYDLDRYEGWAQFGLWLTRPFILREFRFRLDERVNWPGYTDRLTDIIDGVYDSAVKTNFWRNGTLVENADYEHPYQLAIPSQYADVSRSFLLTTSSDPERPWALTDTVPVFALAYVLGASPTRSWLLYAHAPIEAVSDCTITIPGYGDVTVDVPRAGQFWVYQESDMAYIFTERSTTPGAYRFTSGVFANLIALGDIEEGVDRGDGDTGTFAVPAEADVKLGVDYGEDETEFTGTLQWIPTPTDASLCTVQFRVELSNTAVSGAVCKAKLLGINQAASGTILSNAESSDTTDAEGIAELQLVQKGSIVKGNGLYKIWVEISGRPVASINTTIPNQSRILFEELLRA